jgi:sortase A
MVAKPSNGGFATIGRTDTGAMSNSASVGPSGLGDGSVERPRAGSRATTWIGRVGVLALVAGLLVGAYVIWEIYGTNYVSQRTHRDVVAEVRTAWEDTSEHPVGEPVQTDHGRVEALVRIPRFGEDYVVPVFSGTSDSVLAAGFGHFTEGANVGEVGNYALAAHRVTHGEPLRDMPLLEVGDQVVLETEKWTYTYVLDSGGGDLTVPFTETWVLGELPRNPDPAEVEPSRRPGQRLITLTTCAEMFHTDDRLVAFGHLESRRRNSG